MGKHLPKLYLLILVIETIALAVIYAVATPAPSDPLSVWLGTLGLASMIIMLSF